MSNLELQVSDDNGFWRRHFKKFLDTSPGRTGSFESFDQSLNILRKMYNARLCVDDQTYFLVFETEVDKLEFLLTWS